MILIRLCHHTSVQVFYSSNTVHILLLFVSMLNCVTLQTLAHFFGNCVPERWYLHSWICALLVRWNDWTALRSYERQNSQEKSMVQQRFHVRLPFQKNGFKLNYLLSITSNLFVGFVFNAYEWDTGYRITVLFLKRLNSTENTDTCKMLLLFFRSLVFLVSLLIISHWWHGKI